MSTTPLDPTTPDPDRLADVQATDALLDRLGRRAPLPAGADDDPVIQALSALAHDVETPDITPDATVARLLGALAGRPLWLLDGAAGENVADSAAGQDLIALDDPSWEGERHLVIDLTDGAIAAPDGVDRPDVADGDDVAARLLPPLTALPTMAVPTAEVPTAEVPTAQEPTAEVPVAAVPVAEGPTAEAPVAQMPATQGAPNTSPTAPIPLQGRQAGGQRTPGAPPAPKHGSGAVATADRRERALRRLTLPVAAAIAVFAAGGGITAALTGDPMAPIDGVTRVVDELSGQEQPATYSSLQANIRRAQVALQEGDFDEARQLIRTAQRDLGDVPQRDREKLALQIATVSGQIEKIEDEEEAGPPPAVVPPSVPATDEPSVPEVTSPPKPEPSPSAPVTETETSPPPPVVTPDVTETTTPEPTDPPPSPDTESSAIVETPDVVAPQLDAGP